MGRSSIRTWNARWLDQHRDRRFVSSRGADVSHDYQECGIILGFTMGDAATAVQESFRASNHRLMELMDEVPRLKQDLDAHLDRCEQFALEAEPVEAGEATVVLSPQAAGIFAHESFGHKSEADTMLGDPQMLEDWAMGSQVASEGVSIMDGGTDLGSGYMPYDDEGQKTSLTHLIKDGRLTGRLHNALTAAALDEPLTGNARAISFRFEPIVRMTTTTFGPGHLSKDELFAGVKDGYFIETVRHGSGMSTFTIAPGLAWRIRDGQVAEPVRIAVMTGTVFQTLREIDALSDEVEIPFLVGGGCGKLDQWPLSVGFGGPYVRVKRMGVS
jgi:TldD protein